MRIGLVGVGRIGAFHAETLKGLPAVEQVVVTDADAGRAEAIAKDLGVEHAADVGALLESGLDGFVIAAATSAHAELIAAGVTAGLPTF
jgi:myo-inositol 2-dehydrogenase/D-chiro-inositol 1-dehydrogenase